MRNPPKPTVLLISFIFSPNIGGVESHLDDLCAYLTKRGFKIVVLTYQPILARGNAPYIEKHKNLEIRRIPWLKFNLFNRLERIAALQLSYLVPAILFYGFFYLLLNRKKIDVIQAHGFNMAIVGAFLSTLFRIPLVINTHVSFVLDRKTFYAKALFFVLRQAKKILVLTKAAKHELVKIGISSKNIILYHQWIDNKLFYPRNQNEARSILKLKKSKFIIFFAGRFVAAKGVVLLLKAIEKIKSDKVLFVFVGSGPLKNLLQEAGDKSNRIKVVGQIKREELPIYYSAADVTIVPSIQATKTYAEGIQRVFIESLTCGTPVIATVSGGMSELLKKEIGFLIKPNSQSISQVLDKISAQKKKLKNMRLKCIAYAQEQFDYKKNANIIEMSLQ